MDSEDLKDKMQEQRQSLKDAKMMFEQSVETMNFVSKALKARFDSLIKEGFSDGQALAIICARGLG